MCNSMNHVVTHESCSSESPRIEKEKKQFGNLNHDGKILWLKCDKQERLR